MKKSAGHRGAASDGVGGRKPEVAYKTQARAEANLREKLRLLMDVLNTQGATSEVRSSLVAKLPASVRQFNLWQLDEAQGDSLCANSNQTLKRYPELQLSVRSAVLAVRRQQMEAVAERGSREGRLASARRAQKIDRTLREIAERELVRARRELTIARSEAVQSRSQLLSLQVEAGVELDKLRERITALTEENAQLTSAFRKIVPLKRS
ncbi:hypothetical protein [Variovorax paradoxus]|uniref:hypothetical protein n=1 Tax=Variovorax paradoxus TaxID=34073 RepID=UPI0033926154